MKDSVIEKCLAILKRDDVKDELKKVITPLTNIILVEIYPYIYLSLFVVLISFLLHFGIFILLLRSKISFKVTHK